MFVALLTFCIALSLFHRHRVSTAFVNSDERCRRQVIQACGKLSKFFFVNGSAEWQNGLRGNTEKGCDGQGSAEPYTPWANASCLDAFPELKNTTSLARTTVVVSQIGTSQLRNWCAQSSCLTLYSYDFPIPVYLCHLAGNFSSSSCCIETGTLPRSNFNSTNRNKNNTVCDSDVTVTVTDLDSSTGTLAAANGSLTLAVNAESTPALSTETTTTATMTSTSISSTTTSIAVLVPSRSDDVDAPTPLFSPGRRIGLIVGLVLAILGIIGVIVAVVLLRRRRMRQTFPARTPTVTPDTTTTRTSEYSTAPVLSQYESPTSALAR